MRSPAPLALFLVAPLLACFSDGGSTTIMTSVSATTGGSEPGMTGMTGSSGEPGTAGTQASTDTSTGAPTTGGPTPSTGPTTGVVVECEPDAECQAGAVEDGALCDSCGVERRTCQADCTWSPIACEQDLDTCMYWRLPTGSKEWQRFPVVRNSLEPTEPVLGAFALAPQQRIYVLTASRYHILDAPTQTWLEAGPRENILPALAGKTLHHGTSFVQDPPNVIVTLVADTEVFAHTYVAGTNEFVLDAQVPCCGDNWVPPNAPPDPLAVRGAWGHLGDAEGWIPGDVQALCPDEMPPELYGYNLSIGDGFVYPQDIGYCFDFYAPIPFDQFLPFSYPGRPANDLIAGAAWVDGLYIFR